MSVDTVIAIVVGAIFAIISIIQSWKIHSYNKKKMVQRSIEFYYQVMNCVSFDDIPYNFNINYNSENYKKLFIVEGIIGNGGNVVITNDDLLRPLIIKSKNPLNVLDYEIIDQTKDELEVEINGNNEIDNNVLSISLDNIEPKDAFKFRLLIGSNEDSIDLELEGLIKDESVNIKPKVKKIDRYDYTTILVNKGHRQEESVIYYLLIIGGILVGIYFLFIGIQKLFFLWLNDGLGFTLESSETLSFILAIASYIGLIIFTVKMIKRFNSKRKEKKEEKEREKEPSLTGFGPWFDLRIKSEDVYKKYR